MEHEKTSLPEVLWVAGFLYGTLPLLDIIICNLHLSIFILLG